MECRLVLNNLSKQDLSNEFLSGPLKRQLNFYKFRRVPTKNGQSVFYLFFYREEDTYQAIRASKSIKNISLVRYRHTNPNTAPPSRPDDIPPSEMIYRPVPTKRIVDIIRNHLSKYFDQFSTKVCNLL
jgi:hypothetical protein